MVVSKELITLSEPFLISNRFSIKEIIIFELIFNKIDKSLKGFIDKDDFLTYIQEQQQDKQQKDDKDNIETTNKSQPPITSSIALSAKKIDFEKLLVFNTNTLSFYQFLSILSLSGISLDCKDITEESLLPPPPTPIPIASSFSSASNNNVLSSSPLSSSPSLNFLPSLPKTRRSIVIDPSLTRQSSLSSMESANNPKQLQRSMSSIQPMTTPLSSSPSTTSNSPPLKQKKSQPMSIPTAVNSNNNNSNHSSSTPTSSTSSPSLSERSPTETSVAATITTTTSSSPSNNNDQVLNDDNETRRISRMGNHRGAIKRS